ncbi:hypothetical protein IWQ62_000950 [Dispira parvispora]|uniref:Uncharacterized protein n=1 Tax=Dispira parvispora TaxID=1520584 RepID=A0A9W8AUS1_9FUNG|nr:hypothetical protein IWQ62_000950 [Dispira parvispora]
MPSPISNPYITVLDNAQSLGLTPQYSSIEDSEVPLTAPHVTIVQEIADSVQRVSDIIDAQSEVASKLAQFQSHLDCVVAQRARVSSELQQPYHGEHIKLPMAYHADFVTLVKKLLHFIQHTHNTLLGVKALDQAAVDEPRLAAGLTLMNQTLLSCNQYLDNLLEYSALLCSQSPQANTSPSVDSRTCEPE